MKELRGNDDRRTTIGTADGKKSRHGHGSTAREHDRKPGRLSIAFCERTERPGRYSDRGSGLVFVISPTGTKRWIFRFQRSGRRRELGVGPYPVVGLDEARRRALELRRALWEGRDPAHVLRGGATVRTFRETAEALIDARATEWRNAKHRRQWRRTLETYAYPEFGEVPVKAVTTDHVLAVLRPIWTTKTETAARLRGRIEAVLDFARARGWRDGENPARWRSHLAYLLPKPARIRSVHHLPALDWRRLPEFVAELRAMGGVSARALEFLILTAARSGEVREARWREIDLVGGIWTIPAERTKTGREHRIPLGPAALGLLRSLPRLHEVFVFPGRKGRMGETALAAVLERMNRKREAEGMRPWVDDDGRPVTVHGFRSSFRTWAYEATDVSAEIAEAALGHVIGDRVERAYRRGDALERRRGLMEEWERHLYRNSDPTISSVSPAA